LKHAKHKASKMKNFIQMTEKKSKQEWENNERKNSPKNLSGRCQGSVDYLRRSRNKFLFIPMQK
jgi:hypothetical protein